MASIIFYHKSSWSKWVFSGLYIHVRYHACVFYACACRGYRDGSDSASVPTHDTWEWTHTHHTICGARDPICPTHRRRSQGGWVHNELGHCYLTKLIGCSAENDNFVGGSSTSLIKSVGTAYTKHNHLAIVIAMQHLPQTMAAIFWLLPWLPFIISLVCYCEYCKPTNSWTLTPYIVLTL